MPVLVTCIWWSSDQKHRCYIVCKFSHYKSMGKTFNAQVRVTLKRIVSSGLKWYLSQILYLSSVSASLKKIRSLLNALSCPQYFFQCSSAGNSEVNRRMCPKSELVWAFIVVLVTCKFVENMIDDSIKNERASMETPFSHYKSMRNF